MLWLKYKLEITTGISHCQEKSLREPVKVEKKL